MADKFLSALQKENAELIKENSALKETVTKLLQELDNIRGIIPTTETTDISKELQIVEKQIERYQKFSEERELTLEEIRAVDLLIKNKKMLQPKEAKDDEVPSGNMEELLLIAGGKDSKVVETTIKRSKSKTGTKDPVE